MAHKIILALFLFFPTLARAEEPHPYNVSPELDKTIQAGMYELYNFNFDKALDLFASVKSEEKEHPMIAFGVASVYWWRVSTLVLESDKDASAPMIRAINHCIKISEDKINQGDPTGEGHLTLGGALGLMGRWQAANREWTGAYFKGKKAYKNLVKALEINPKLLDANMGKGIFDYYIATLPSVVRVLAFIGMGGDPNIGLKELELAGTGGIYSRTPAQLFLADIYSNIENTPEKSFPILKSVREEYPQSSFIHMMHIIALYNAGRLPELEAEAHLFQQKIIDGSYTKESQTLGWFAAGVSHFKAKQWTEAEAPLLKAAQSTDLKDPWRTWAALYLGYVYDLEGKRKEAVGQYKMVLDQMRRWGSHDAAKMYLKKPFKATDEEMKKLRL